AQILILEGLGIAPLLHPPGLALGHLHPGGGYPVGFRQIGAAEQGALVKVPGGKARHAKTVAPGGEIAAVVGDVPAVDGGGKASGETGGGVGVGFGENEGGKPPGVKGEDVVLLVPRQHGQRVKAGAVVVQGQQVALILDLALVIGDGNGDGAIEQFLVSIAHCHLHRTAHLTQALGQSRAQGGGADGEVNGFQQGAAGGGCGDIARGHHHIVEGGGVVDYFATAVVLPL